MADMKVAVCSRLWAMTCAVTLIAVAPSVPGLAESSRGFNGVQDRLLISEPSVVVRCPLTVGGSFDAKTTALSGELTIDSQNQAELAGSLTVDLRTLQTGIKLRDTHMRDNYLEVQKPGFEHATLTNIRLEGNTSEPVGKVAFTGVLAVHGLQRNVAGTADIRRVGDSLRVQASFPVKVSEFEIASPSYLGVGVRDEVNVAVTFSAITRRTN
jgi:polyisoprenoid-binding protein YceI